MSRAAAASARAPLCLAGPTASGKTAAALALAQHWPNRFEIISVDSALVYRGMDIGTAKPTPAQRAVVVHHLIDIIPIAEPMNIAHTAGVAHGMNELIRWQLSLASDEMFSRLTGAQVKQPNPAEAPNEDQSAEIYSFT